MKKRAAAKPPADTVISDVTIYTVLHSRKLAAMYLSGRRGTFDEQKRWVSAARLLKAAKNNGHKLPLVFAAAEGIWELIYFGFIQEVTIKGDTTTVRVTDLTRIKTPRPNKTQLVVRSTMRKLSPHYIRNYSLVLTPRFILRTHKST